MSDFWDNEFWMDENIFWQVAAELLSADVTVTYDHIYNYLREEYGLESMRQSRNGTELLFEYTDKKLLALFLLRWS